ncbi:MAG: hypothetical protein NTY48_02340 [Candidatus Diapherotrites archaeon]|nr:hypothetical protein [Candidatus Diapherotrites archaeon]
MSQHNIEDKSQPDSCQKNGFSPALLRPRSILYLTKVSYNEPKHEVLVEFSCESERFVKREKFFPFILFSPSIEKDKLQSLLLSAGFKGFSLEVSGQFLCLRALSFSELKRISNSLAVFINKKPLVLEPERVYLLSKGWSFFDSFEKIDDFLYKLPIVTQNSNSLQNSNNLGNSSNLKSSNSSKNVNNLGNSKKFQNIPDLGFFLTKEIPFKEALELSREDVLHLVELSAWSNLLSVPLSNIPKSKGERLELFIENLFFKNGELLSFDSSSRFYSSNGFEPLGGVEPLSKLDFSFVWTELFSNTFFNIGPETRNCSCCSPALLEAKNLLPSSLILVRFLGDNVFFESSSESFASSFHSSRPFKDLRVAKRKEFFLNSFPIGPFFREDSVLLPLLDARRLISEGKVVLVSSKGVSYSQTQNELKQINSQKNASSQNQLPFHDLNWFCLNKESFFSKEIRSSTEVLLNLRFILDSNGDSLFSSKDFSAFYLDFLHSALSFSLANIPNQLTNSESKFFSTALAKGIISVQEATIAKFKEFSEKRGYRVLHANKSAAFVKGFDSLKLAKEFACSSNLPQPIVAGFSSKRALGFA